MVHIKKLIVFCFMLLGCDNLAYGQEFLYPIAVTRDISGEQAVLVIYQTASATLELWQWNPEDKHAFKLLPSYCSPSHVSVRLDGSFSFIDNNAINIKSRHKRAAKVVPMEEPLYNFSAITWVTPQNGYGTAQYRGRYGIFQWCNEQDLMPLVIDRKADYLYPNKIGDLLFYIRKSHDVDQGYQIMQSAYPDDIVSPSLTSTELFLADVHEPQDLYKNKVIHEQTCLLEQTDPLGFLTMISANEGFVLGYDAVLGKHDTHITMRCYHLKQYVDGWKLDELFRFSLPTSLILPIPDLPYLCESIVPLLPRYADDFIIFSDSKAQGGDTALLTYNRRTGAITPQTKARGFFSPLIINQRCYFGGQVTNSFEHPHFYIEGDGSVCLQIPFFVF